MPPEAWPHRLDNYPAGPGLQPAGHDWGGVTDIDFRRLDTPHARSGTSLAVGNTDVTKESSLGALPLWPLDALESPMQASRHPEATRVPRAATRPMPAILSGIAPSATPRDAD